MRAARCSRIRVIMTTSSNHHTLQRPHEAELAPVADATRDVTRRWVRALVISLLFYTFLVGVNGMGEGFHLLGRDALEGFFRATQNPFVGLVVGILATSVVQSSSVTTSLIVGLVAAPDNPLPLQNAVPMVMGANFGTTVTNTVVSLAHVRNREEFRRAFAVSTCDDFFNLYTVFVLLPVELSTGLLQRTATALAGLLSGFGGVDYESPLKTSLRNTLGPVLHMLGTIMPSERASGGVLALLSFAIIFGSLILLIRALRSVVETRAHEIIAGALDKKPLLSMLGGLLVTVMIQSSSITTSLLVPLAGAGVLTLSNAFPIVLGANLGTTMTALMASMATTGANAEAGLAIALVHCLFNFFGILLFFPILPLRRLPLAGSEWLANLGARCATLAILYVVLLFYGIPLGFAVISGMLP